MNNPNNQPQAKVNINLDTMPDEVCGAEIEDQPLVQYAKCDGIEFTKVFQFKRISALVSPTGKELIYPLEFIRCLKCGAAKVLK